MKQKGFTFAGHRIGRSLLIDDGALTWLIANSSTNSASTRRHVELALCHLAQNGKILTTIHHYFDLECLGLSEFKLQVTLCKYICFGEKN